MPITGGFVPAETVLTNSSKFPPLVPYNVGGSGFAVEAVYKWSTAPGEMMERDPYQPTHNDTDRLQV